MTSPLDTGLEVPAHTGITQGDYKIPDGHAEPQMDYIRISTSGTQVWVFF